MSLFKKYPAFSLSLLVLILATAVGGFVLWQRMQAASKAERAMLQAQQSLESALRRTPAPTPANLKQAQRNVEVSEQALVETLSIMEGNLQRDFEAEAQGKAPTTFILELNEWARKLRREARNRNIGHERTFNFGFERFIRTGATPPPQNLVPKIYKQKEIINYLVTELFDAVPTTEGEQAQEEQALYIVDVARESIMTIAQERNEPGLFTVSPDVTAEVPGVVDTLAFKITFISRTDVLREFLQSIAKFELPLVVRSVEVSPGRDISGRTGTDEDGEGVSQAQTQVPVVESNYNEFTIVVEYVDITMPTDAEDAETTDQN